MDFDGYIEKERINIDLQEKKIEINCSNCGADIYEGNEYFNLEGYDLCEDCFDEIQRKEKNEHRYVAGEE